MFEILLAIWSICLLLSMIVVAINFTITRRKFQSEKLRVLNENLTKVNLFWSSSSGDFAQLSESSIEEDRYKSLRNVLLTGLLGLVSIPGFLLLVLLALSSHKLARSRKETATFQSVLANEVASDPKAVAKTVSELNQIF